MVEDQWFREMLLHSNEVEHIFAGAMRMCMLVEVQHCILPKVVEGTESIDHIMKDTLPELCQLVGR